MLTHLYAPALEHMQQLYSQSTRASCIQIRSVAELAGCQSQNPLSSYQFPRDNINYLNDRANVLERYWQARRELCDDSIPCLSPYYGIAEHSAFLGGDVSFAQDTSYHHPILKRASEWTDLKIDPDNQWVQLFREGYSFYIDHWSDRFFIKYRGAYGPMDLANVIRGNDLFLDFYDDPEHVQKLMDFAVRANHAYLQLQREYVPIYQDGIISGFDIWMPAGSVGHLSEDASCLCSLEQYEAFGAPWMHKQIEPYDMVLLHLHSMGRKNVPGFAGMEKIRLIQLTSDPKEPSALVVMQACIDVLREKIIIVDATWEELVKHADLLRDLRCLLFYHAQTMSEAQEAITFVRQGFRA